MPLRRFKPDVVLIYGDFFDFLPVVLQHTDFKVILATVGVTRLSRQLMLLNAVRPSHQIRAMLCHSFVIEDFQYCEQNGLGPKTVVISNGVDFAEMQVEAKKEDIFPDLADRKWILSVSNFFPGKNQEELFTISAMLPNPKEWAVIQVCNYIEFPIGITLESKWRSKASHSYSVFGLASRLAKNYKREAVVSLFVASDVLAMTSQKEVTPLVILEAMAAGLPWVSTDIGETKAFDGGFVVPAPKDSLGNSIFTREVRAGFVGAILQSASSSTINAKEQVSATYDWKNILPQYGALINRVHTEA